MIIKNCLKCDISLYRKNIVNGYGLADADIMFIGEAPGYYEDKYGYPFIGKAGIELTKMIEITGLKRENVYITNIIKCRPPANRLPTDIEVNNCLPYLIKEIKEVNPKIIVLLGGFAMRIYFNNTKLSITKYNGEVFKTGKRYVIPIYHPAYILRNKNKLDKALVGYKRLSILYREFINPYHRDNI